MSLYSHVKNATAERGALTKMADLLRVHDVDAIEWCVSFIEADTDGYWHSRGRARMSIRLKRCALTADQRARLLRVVLQRLVSGTLPRNFKDQLRLALSLDRERVMATPRDCMQAGASHVRRFSGWVLAYP